VLFEKGELTSNPTWITAGLVPHLIGERSRVKFHCTGSELYKQLETEAGQATVWHGCGVIRLGVTTSRLLFRMA
jgi:hypothetical protein